MTMTRKKSKHGTKFVHPIVEREADRAIAATRPAYAAAVDAAPRDTRTPSQQMAERYRVEERNYTARERDAAEHAMDFNGTARNALTFIENTGFPGFPTLSLLGQLPEYRTMHETLADECIRQWGKVTSAGEADPEKLAEIEAEIKRYDVSAVVRQAVIHDQGFGGAHVYFKLKGDENFRETPLVMKPFTVRKGSFEGLRVVEPYWVTPNYYNSIDPTAADFYKPSSWWMLGTETHATRLQTIISRPVADMLKPSYSFRGVSMTQLAMPYVDNWLRTRQSVSDAVKQFSISGVKTDMQQMLTPGAATDMANRAELINRYRDNRNLLFLDMATEEFFQVNTPLSGLDALQAQSQEQMSAVSHIPLVKLLGVTPTGLNASSEGEIRVFYDYVHGYQKNVLTSLMLNIVRVIQLSKFGEIDKDIGWEWAPLMELTGLEAADARERDAQTDALYIENQVVTPQQVAQRLNTDPHSLYAGTLETGETLDTTPDTDIASITQHILQIEDGTGGPLLEKSPIDEGVSALQGVAGRVNAAPPAAAGQELQAEATMGEHESALSLEDPSAESDLGAMDSAMDDHWVTAHPNGPENEGTPLLIGEGGKVIGGAGGKLNGQTKGGAQPAATPAKTPAKVKLKEGHQAVEPFAVTKDPWGDYEAPGIEGSLPKQHVTIKAGRVVGMHPQLAKNTGKAVTGEVQAKSEKTLTKEREAAEKKTQEEQSRKNDAALMVFQMTLSKKLAGIPKDKLTSVTKELSAALQKEGASPVERVAEANRVLAAAKGA